MIPVKSIDQHLGIATDTSIYFYVLEMLASINDMIPNQSDDINPSAVNKSLNGRVKQLDKQENKL